NRSRLPRPAVPGLPLPRTRSSISLVTAQAQRPRLQAPILAETEHTSTAWRGLADDGCSNDYGTTSKQRSKITIMTRINSKIQNSARLDPALALDPFPSRPLEAPANSCHLSPSYPPPGPQTDGGTSRSLSRSLAGPIALLSSAP